MTINVNIMDSALVRNGVLRRVLCSPRAALSLCALRILRSFPRQLLPTSDCDKDSYQEQDDLSFAESYFSLISLGNGRSGGRWTLSGATATPAIWDSSFGQRAFLTLSVVVATARRRAARTKSAVLEAQRRVHAAYDNRVVELLSEVSLSDVYFWILTRRSSQVRKALEVLADGLARAPVLVHCTHGKDRTGIIISLILHICGADRNEVAVEYARTNAWASSEEGLAAQATVLPQRLVSRLDLSKWCCATEESIREVWQSIEGSYGSLDAYLDAIGVSHSTRSTIRDVLTEPVSTQLHVQ
mmetsp:Transcript_27353/g.83163  ORF Transcript_27353/g.83163 Transcript_27353/m.83163 type:complete len:300 (-) Transcript_27353:342-1241(-)